MELRNVPVGRGLDWFKQAIDLGARNPRAVFGGALFFIASLYLLAFLFAIVAAMLIGGGDQPVTAAELPAQMRRLFMMMVPLFLLVMLLVPILIGGLMHVIRESEAGRPVRARDVFAPLRSAAGRKLALLGLVQVVLAIAGAALMFGIAGADYWRDYLQAMQGALSGTVPVVPQPDNAGLLLLSQLVFNYFSYALMLFAIPLMLFSGLSLGPALQAALMAAVRNVGANLLAGVLFIGTLLVATLVFALVAGLAALIGRAIHPAFGELLAMVLMLGFASVVLVLVVGGAYLAWRDTFGDAAAPPPLPVEHGIEV